MRKEDTKKLSEIVRCPITGEVMRDPVSCADGFSYERKAIEKWLETHDTSPMTNLVLPNKTLTTNISLKQIIESGVGMEEELRSSAPLSVVKPLAARSAPAEAPAENFSGDSPVHMAVRRNNQELLKRMALTDSNLLLKNAQGFTAIELAAELGQWDLVLLIARANCPSELRKRNDGSRYCNGNGYFREYLEEADPEKIHLLRTHKRVSLIAIKNGKSDILLGLHEGIHRIDMNRGDLDDSLRDNDGYCAIHHAVMKKDLVVLDKLLASAQRNDRDSQGRTAIEFAADTGCWDMVSHIAKRVRSSDKTIYNKILLKASQENKTEAALVLEQAGASFADAMKIFEAQKIEEQRIKAMKLTEDVRREGAVRINEERRRREELVEVARREEEAKIRALSIPDVREYHKNEAGFFSMSTRRIFDGKSPRSVVRGLREEAANEPGSAAAKTVRKFGLS